MINFGVDYLYQIDFSCTKGDNSDYISVLEKSRNIHKLYTISNQFEMLRISNVFEIS